MKKTALALMAFLALPAFAQDNANPLSTWLRNAYRNNHAELLGAAEKMPEEFYGMRPGPQQEVRTFGQQIAHYVMFNYLWCAQAKGEKNPNAGHDLGKLTAKADLIKALNDAYSYCEPVYNSLTDASGAETIDITQENGRQTHSLRMALLIQNWGHNNEIYGIVTVYMREKSIVPPSSEPRPGRGRGR